MSTTPNGHSKYGPSKASRWLHCHASIVEEAKYPSTTSKYAEEGTCAHRLAEICLRNAVEGKKIKPRKYIGRTCDETGLMYNEDMVEAVEEYIRIVFENYNPKKDEMYIEHKMHTPSINEHLFGTSDCVILKPKRLVTVDFKYGRGVVVVAEDNEQMLLYTLMADESLGRNVRGYKQIIVQPRAEDPASRHTEWEYTPKTIDQFTLEVIVALKHIAKVEALAAKGKKIPEKYYAPDQKRCHFCRASGNCKAQDKYNLDVMSQDYEVVTHGNEFAPPLPSTLSPERVAFVLEHRKAITEWLNAVEAHAIHALKHDSKAVPGYKVVHGRSNRRWKDDIESPKVLKKFLKAVPSLDRKDLFSTKLLTLTQIEALIKKQKGDLKALEPFWEKPPGKLTLVSADDGRKGISSLDDYE